MVWYGYGMARYGMVRVSGAFNGRSQMSPKETSGPPPPNRFIVDKAVYSFHLH